MLVPGFFVNGSLREGSMTITVSWNKGIAHKKIGESDKVGVRHEKPPPRHSLVRPPS